MSITRKKLFLIDAFAIIFRGYYAFIKNPRINSKDMNTSAIFGFMNSLLEILKKEKPDHIGVAFDKGGSVDRVQVFEAYKANRDETPDAIKIAVPIIQDILKAMDIPILELSGYEADDIIGTIAHKAAAQQYDVYMVTPDKDYAQLVTEHIFMYKPARMGNGIEIWGVEQVKEKFEVETPLQVIDYLAMMGDAVDNIPGLVGVGDKTAKKFIKQYGSIEKLLENTDDIKGKLKEKVEQSREQGLLSKQLATIMLDVPVVFKEEDYKLNKPNFEAIHQIFEELEFRRMLDNIKKIFDEPIAKPPAVIEKKSGEIQLDMFAELENTAEASSQTPQYLYQEITTPFGKSLLYQSLSKQTQIGIDIETIDTASDGKATIVALTFSIQDNVAYYVPIVDDEIRIFQPILENTAIEKISYNIKQLTKVLYHYDIQLQGKLFDTMLASYIINPDIRHDKKLMAQRYINYQYQSTDAKEILAEDTQLYLRLKLALEKLLAAQNSEKLLTELEMPLSQVLSEMELEGINIDQQMLNEYSKKLGDELTIIENKIYQLSETEFNISSPKQLGEVLFDKMKLVDKPKKTKTGHYTTGEEVLLSIKNKHEIIPEILEYRQLQKLKSTYVDALPKQVNERTHRIHTEYMQAVAATGRLSSNHPNLQNIPIRTERGKMVRKAFVPRNADYILLAADYSQIEIRIIAALSGDNGLMEAFKNNEDVHTATAAKLFDVPKDKVTREQRGNAKTVNFSIIYGVSAFGLSQRTEMSRTEAKELIENYYKTYPQLQEYMQNQVEIASEQGYVETVMGRRRYLADINSANHVVRSFAQRNAVNAPIQGSAADIIKLAMIQIQEYLKKEKLQTKMILQVHDELVFDVYKPELETVQKKIKHYMENAYTLSVPLLVEMDYGDNWLAAH